MSSYIPPFTITPYILKKSQEIFKELGLIMGQKLTQLPFKLRRINNIKTIHASLAIEGNTLDLKQVTHIIEGKRVIGPEKDILEVKNASLVYDAIQNFNPLHSKDLLKAHGILMKNLVEESGCWRSSNVGIFKGSALAHMAPPAYRVPSLMKDLFTFLKNNSEISWLLKACIFHYEFEFIHPFMDGNGRMGRLWQQLLLMKEDPVFEFIPVEVLIKNNQEQYYEVLSKSDHLGTSTPFIEFSLTLIHEALIEYQTTTSPLPMDAMDRLLFASRELADRWFSRKEYLSVHKDISTATASRDLLCGVEKGLLKYKGNKNQSFYYYL
jgi:Fic family protein